MARARTESEGQLDDAVAVEIADRDRDRRFVEGEGPRRPQRPIGGAEVQALGLSLLTSLLSAFIITIMVDLLFIVLIFIFEGFLNLVLGRRVQYHR